MIEHKSDEAEVQVAERAPRPAEFPPRPSGLAQASGLYMVTGRPPRKLVS